MGLHIGNPFINQWRLLVDLCESGVPAAYKLSIGNIDCPEFLVGQSRQACKGNCAPENPGDVVPVSDVALQSYDEL